MKYTSFGSNTVQVANLPAQTIATLQRGGSHLYGNGADAALLIEWRRHYTMSVGLLQFHLSSDLNLTSKTFLFSPPARAGFLFTLARGFAVPPSLPASPYGKSLPSILFFFINFPIDSFCSSRFPEFIPRRVGTILLLREKSRGSLRGVWDVVARAGLGWNLFLGQLSPLPGDGWRDREEAAAASQSVCYIYCAIIYDITHLIKLFF